MQQEIVERLNIALKESGHTARWLSLQTEITPANLSHYLNGKRVPNSINLAKICDALNVSVDWVLGLKNEVIFESKQDNYIVWKGRLYQKVDDAMPINDSNSIEIPKFI